MTQLLKFIIYFCIGLVLLTLVLALLPIIILAVLILLIAGRPIRFSTRRFRRQSPPEPVASDIPASSAVIDVDAVELETKPYEGEKNE